VVQQTQSAQPEEKQNQKKIIPIAELIALITGTGAGIGEAIAQRFAEAGANLELVDKDEAKLSAVKEDLQQAV